MVRLWLNCLAEFSQLNQYKLIGRCISFQILNISYRSLYKACCPVDSCEMFIVTSTHDDTMRLFTVVHRSTCPYFMKSLNVFTRSYRGLFMDFMAGLCGTTKGALIPLPRPLPPSSRILGSGYIWCTFIQWRIQDLIKGAKWRGLGDRSPPAMSGALPQLLAYFCYLKENFECSEALQVWNFNVQCVCYNQKLTIIAFIQKCSQ